MDGSLARGVGYPMVFPRRRRSLDPKQPNPSRGGTQSKCLDLAVYTRGVRLPHDVGRKYRQDRRFVVSAQIVRGPYS